MRQRYIHPSRFGKYYLTKRWYNGDPVYLNNNDQILYILYSQNLWGIGSSIGLHGIRGSPVYLCPSKSTKWEYGGIWET